MRITTIDLQPTNKSQLSTCLKATKQIGVNTFAINGRRARIGGAVIVHGPGNKDQLRFPSVGARNHRDSRRCDESGVILINAALRRSPQRPPVVACNTRQPMNQETGGFRLKRGSRLSLSLSLPPPRRVQVKQAQLRCARPPAALNGLRLL